MGEKAEQLNNLNNKELFLKNLQRCVGENNHATDILSFFFSTNTKGLSYNGQLLVFFKTTLLRYNHYTRNHDYFGMTPLLCRESTIISLVHFILWHFRKII